MEKTFRDILAEFLEGNDENFTAVPSEKAPSQENHSYIFEPLWRPDYTQNPSREGMSRYKTHKAADSSRETPQTEAPASPPPEVLIPLEKLHSADLARARELITLGATDLTQGLSLKRLKKAHRLLARKYHPDRLTGATPEQVKTAMVKFTIVQAAYETLLETLLPTESAKSA